MIRGLAMKNVKRRENAFLQNYYFFSREFSWIDGESDELFKEKTLPFRSVLSSVRTETSALHILVLAFRFSATD